MSVAVKLDALHVSVDRKRSILADISLSIAAGDTVLVQGDNGAGKSTLLAALALALPPEKGEVLHQGMNHHRVFERVRARFLQVNLRYVPQQPAFFDGLTVAQNVLATEYVPDQELSSFLASISLPGDQFCGSLSGGERARLALALATTGDAGLMLLDEPSAALSDVWCVWLLEKLRLLRARGATVVLATHDARLTAARDLFSHAIALASGRAAMRRFAEDSSHSENPT